MPSDLVGTWRLLSYEARDSEGRVQYPLGERLTGQLIYESGGNMSVQVMTDGRPLFAANDSAHGTDAEVRTAFDGYTAYFGNYTVDAPALTVTHHIRGCSYPNWVGTDQRRHYELNGDRLLLSARIAFDGQTLDFVLNWQRT